MKYLLLLSLLLAPLALADSVLIETSYQCSLNPDGYFLRTERFPTEAEARARIPGIVDEHETEVLLTCSEMELYGYVSAPPDPIPTGAFQYIPDVPFDYMREPGAVTSTGTMPSSLNGGDVHQLTNTDAPGDVSLTCNASPDNPAFILGGRVSSTGDLMTIGGSGCFFIGTDFDNIQPRTSGSFHVLRDVRVHDHLGKNGSSLGGSNIVLVDSEIDHNQGDDRHGIYVSPGSDGVWILRNTVHHNGGDGFQACHGCSNNPPKNVYIGANVFHSDRENGVDFKFIDSVVVESNTFHSMVSAPPDVEWCFNDGSKCGVFSSGSDGSAIVIGSDGAPTNVIIANNEIYDTNIGIRIEESNGVQIIGNNMHDLAARCLQLDKNGIGTVYRGNSCVNTERGIFQNWRVNFTLTVDDNLFQNLSGPAIEYETADVGLNSTLTGNIFTSTGAIMYKSFAPATTTATVNDLPGASGNVVN